MICKRINSLITVEPLGIVVGEFVLYVIFLLVSEELHLFFGIREPLVVENLLYGDSF